VGVTVHEPGSDYQSVGVDLLPARPVNVTYRNDTITGNRDVGAPSGRT
jgi:hypothetical protein